MHRSFSGVFPILVTPFLDDGKVDFESQLRVVDHLLEQGAHGLGAFGNAGEGYTLLPSEKRRLLDAIVHHVSGRAPVIGGVGATGTASAVEACREAEGQGASGLMVLPPYYLRPDADGLRYFFSAISDSVSIPIMVQDAPMLSQVNMPPMLLARMAREIEHVEYAKVEAPPTAQKTTNLNFSYPLESLGLRRGIYRLPDSRLSRAPLASGEFTLIEVIQVSSDHFAAPQRGLLAAGGPSRHRVSS